MTVTWVITIALLLIAGALSGQPLLIVAAIVAYVLAVRQRNIS